VAAPWQHQQVPALTLYIGMLSERVHGFVHPLQRLMMRISEKALTANGLAKPPKHDSQ
jgi:hypothetical protein